MENDVGSYLRTCAGCTHILSSKPSVIYEWQTKEFCSSNCLATSVSIDEKLDICSSCKNHVGESAKIKYCVRFGSVYEQFCSFLCIDNFKSRPYCKLCQERILSFMVIYEEEKFCSPFCISRWEGKGINQVYFVNQSSCYICEKIGVHHYEMLRESSVFFCSKKCILKYEQSEGPVKCVCGLCGCLLMASYDHFYKNGVLKEFCSRQCSNIYLVTTAQDVSCSICQVKKYCFDMITKQLPDKSEYFCSLKCLLSTIPTDLLDKITSNDSKSCPEEKLPILKVRSMSQLNEGGIIVDIDNEPHIIEKSNTNKNSTLEKTTENCILRRKIEDLYEQSFPITTSRGVEAKVEMNSSAAQFDSSVNSHDKYSQVNIPYNSVRCLPVPFPVYLPSPILQPGFEPTPLVIPLPVPVPVPIPLLRKPDEGESDMGNSRRYSKTLTSESTDNDESQDEERGEMLDENLTDIVNMCDLSDLLPVDEVVVDDFSLSHSENQVNSANEWSITQSTAKQTDSHKTTLSDPPSLVFHQNDPLCQPAQSFKTMKTSEVPTMTKQLPRCEVQLEDSSNLFLKYSNEFKDIHPTEDFQSTNSSSENELMDDHMCEDDSPEIGLDDEYDEDSHCIEKDSQADKSFALKQQQIPKVDALSRKPEGGKCQSMNSLSGSLLEDQTLYDSSSNVVLKEPTSSTASQEKVQVEDSFKGDPSNSCLRPTSLTEFPPERSVPKETKLFSRFPGRTVTRPPKLKLPSPQDELFSPTTRTLQQDLGSSLWNELVLSKRREKAESGKEVESSCTNFATMPNGDKNDYLVAFLKELLLQKDYHPNIIIFILLSFQKFVSQNLSVDSIFLNIFFQRFGKVFYHFLQQHFDSFSDNMVFLESSLRHPGLKIRESMLWEAAQLGSSSPNVLLFTVFYLNTKIFKLGTLEEHEAVNFQRMHRFSTPRYLQDGTPVVARNLRYICSNDAEKKIRREIFEDSLNPMRCPFRLHDFYTSKCPAESFRSGNFYLTPILGCCPESKTWFSSRRLPSSTLKNMINFCLMVEDVQQALRDFNQDAVLVLDEN